MLAPRFLVLVSALLLCFVSMAQPTRIVVYDLQTGLGIPYAQIKLSCSDGVFDADSSGRVFVKECLYEEALVSAWLYQSKTYKGKLPDSVGLAANFIELSEVRVVSGTNRFEEFLKAQSLNITHINAQDIARFNPGTTAWALENSGEVFVQRSQAGGGSPNLRGAEANRVLLVVDGIRMNNAIYRAGHVQNILSVDAGALERIEVHHGTGALVYGSDAMGGSIQLYTRQPKFAPDDKKFAHRVNVLTRFASAAREGTAHVDFNVGSPRFAAFGSFTASHFGDLRTGSLFSDTAMASRRLMPFYQTWQDTSDVIRFNPNPLVQPHSGYRQMDAVQKLRWKASEKTDLTLNLHYSTTGLVPRTDEMSRSSVYYGTDSIIARSFDFGEWHYGPQKRWLAALHTDLKDASPLFSLGKITAAFQRIDEDRITRRFGRPIRQYQEENVSVYSLNADFVKRLEFPATSVLSLFYGMEGVYNAVRSLSRSRHLITGEISRENIGTRYPDGGSRMATGSTYFCARWQSKQERLTLSAGLRYTFQHLYGRYIDTTLYSLPYSSIGSNSHAPTGGLSFAVLPGKGWKLGGGVSTCFHAPNLDDFAKIRARGGTVLVPNPALRPEYGINSELNLSKQIAGRVYLGATGWFNYFFDALVQSPFTLNGQDSMLYDGRMCAIVANVNAARAFVGGGNASLSVQPSAAWLLRATVSYQYGRTLQPDGSLAPLSQIPPLFGQLSAAYNLRRFSFFALLRFQGAKLQRDYATDSEDNFDFALPQGTPAWFVVNLYAEYKFNDYLRLQLAVENLLDWHYRPFSSSVSAPGMNAIVALRGSF